MRARCDPGWERQGHRDSSMRGTRPDSETFYLCMRHGGGMTDDIASEEPGFDYEGYAMGIPCDPELLEPLGRVGVAQSRLLGRMRDAINRIDGEPSDGPFDFTLGEARRALRTRVDKRKLTDPEGARPLDRWLRGPGGGAIQARNGVVHAMAITADDGKQALRTTHKHGSFRVLPSHLLKVAGMLERASSELPMPGWVDPSARTTPD